MPRMPSSTSADRLDDESGEYKISPSPSVTSREWTKEDQHEFLKSVTGVFNITSEAIEGEWPRMSQRLTIRFHVDEEQNKIWGRFDMGIVDGSILLNPSPGELEHDTPMKFQWRGRQSETGSPEKGSGELTISENRTIRGVFHGMCGNIDFKGRRRLMPSGISGQNVGFYRQSWEDYAPWW
jgi:hypothetical protein